MRNSNRWVVGLLIIACLQLTACTQILVSPSNEGQSVGTPPAKVEPSGQAGFSRVILTAEAFKRLGIETVPVRNMPAQGTQSIEEAVPYSAILYGTNGETWVYTNPEPLTFVRAVITIDSINGDLALLSAGPPVGTMVVTVGATELYGTEFEPTQQYALAGEIILVGATELPSTGSEGSSQS